MTENNLNYDQWKKVLAEHGQEHVLGHWPKLTAREREGLCQQLNEIDFVELGDLLAGQDETTDFKALAMRAASPPAVLADGSGADWSPAEAREPAKRL